jgi:hypothetical protein
MIYNKYFNDLLKNKWQDSIEPLATKYLVYLSAARHFRCRHWLLVPVSIQFINPKITHVLKWNPESGICGKAPQFCIAILFHQLCHAP